MIPQSFIQELLARIDVVEVIGRYVQLKKGGANFMGLCPFHNEKSPSFTVSQSKQFYHCFGCGVHGSAIGFLMEHLGVSYVEAITDLARDAGMTVPQEQRGDSQAAREAPGLLQTLEQAGEFYRNRLKDSPIAVDYLKQRGLSGQIAKKFALGYAPSGWRALEASFEKYDATELVTAGLVIEGDAGDDDQPKKRYDRFRERVMFPIRNPKGQVIGFGGRVIGDGEPKYLNSPETPVFSKGRELYGLFEGRDAIRTGNTAIVVEGYMDVVMLAQHGVENAVATLGTATTPVHIQKLMRIVDRIVFSFDGDKAGRRAARRALETCLPLAADEKRIDFLFLPAEHDPDSFVRDEGRERFDELLKNATSLSEFLIQELTAENDLTSAEGTATFQAQSRPLLQLLPRQIALRSQLMRRVASLAQIEIVELESYLSAKPLPANMQPNSQSNQLGQQAQQAANFGQGRDPNKDQWKGKSKWQDKDKSKGSDQDRYSGYVPSPRRPTPLAVESRVRMLGAMYPDLCREHMQSDEPAMYLSADLTEWFTWLGRFPQGANFASVCEDLGQRDPAAVSQLAMDVQRELGALEFSEAHSEFFGAINSLRRRQITVLLTQLAESGLRNRSDTTEYQRLTELSRQMAAPKT